MASNSYFFQKQVVYAGFFSRILAAIFDFSLLYIFTNPIIAYVENKLFQDMTHPIIFLRNSLLSLIQHSNSTSVFWNEIHHYFSNGDIIWRIVIDIIIQFFIINSFILLFWIKRQATPGKLLMKIKIVREFDLNPPTILQLISRLLGYYLSAFLLFFGFMLIGLNKNKKGLHDFMGGTIVIKS